VTDQHTLRGIAGLNLTREDVRSPALQKVLAALRDEQLALRESLEPVQNIESTTVTRGQLHMVKKILARADEVGPESWQSEAEGPESASARAATGMPEGF
jgi:hypothetical protein